MGLFKKWWFWVIVILVIYFVYQDMGLYYHTYERSTIRKEDGCNLFIENCMCFGSLFTFEKFPPGYQCDGIERCQKIEPPRLGDCYPGLFS